MIDWKTAFGCALAGLILVAVATISGCGDSNGTTDGGTDAVQSDESATSDLTVNGGLDPATSADAELFADWSKPAVAVVLSGQQRGYIEPCGCTEGQSGGISRRARLIGDLKEKGWPVTAFDLGGTVRRDRRQSQVKFETMLAAMKDMGYRGLGIAPQEIRFGADYLLSQNVVDEEHPEEMVTFLGANMVMYDTPDLGTPMHSRVVEIGGHKIGVTSVVGKSAADKAFPDGPPPNIKLIDAADSLKPVVEEFKKQQTSLNVLLAYANTAEIKALLKQYPLFQVAVSADGPEDPDKRPQRVGESMLLEVGQKGKYVGVVGLFPDDEKTPLRYQLVELKKDRFKDDMKMVEHMRAYQQQLKYEKLAATELPIRHPSGASYVGAEACGECHTKAYDIWKKTPHAQAFESLKHARKGDPEYGITRIYDAECLACHVTGWHPQQVLRYETGFVNEEFATADADKMRSKLLQGQQCESCHGPGSKHLELIDAGEMDAAREAVRVTLKQAEEKTCIGCHDLDNSPHYDFKTYWKQVEHHGTD